MIAVFQQFAFFADYQIGCPPAPAEVTWVTQDH